MAGVPGNAKPSVSLLSPDCSASRCARRLVDRRRSRALRRMRRRPDADWASIRVVISSQLDAFERDDADAAFSFAPPFSGSSTLPASSSQMVSAGYGRCTGRQTVRFLEPFVLSGQPIQPLEIVAPDASVVVAFYIMERQPGGDWKIVDCAGASSAVSA